MSSTILHQEMEWRFDNSYAQLPENFFTRMFPIRVQHPRIAIFNAALAQELGLSFRNASDEYLAQVFSGNLLPKGSQPLAQAYAGHQFGHFTYLGDGRAHLLGEHKTPDGRRFDIQLKGSGKTPYGRNGDGRAALGPMLREYIMSEAMNALGIPTTRSLAVVTTGELVYRENALQGAILTRVASSHLRVGTFEYLAAEKDKDGLKKLADYTIARHYPEIEQAEQPYLQLLKEILEKQADLITNWMRVGFIHGVMNTDNMALCGETIDYGPCAFMDTYDPLTVFSSIDHRGRYAYGNQPVIAQWNLARFAETILPLLHENEIKAIQMAEEAIAEFSSLYLEKWQTMMRAKLGLFKPQTGDETLIRDLLKWMQQEKADFTNTFMDLSAEKKPEKEIDNHEFQNWYTRWQLRLQQQPQALKDSHSLMSTHNPAIIPRNHNVEHALELATQGDMEPFHRLLSALKNPYQNCPEIKAYQSPPTPSERVYQTFCGT
jgi:uncharacterized protein YdiU (UPF0061 family)